MSKPAARIGDMHMCPMVTPGTPPVPHVGGPITGPGAPTVLIGGMPAAVLGDMCTCTGPPDSIALGSTGVLIQGKPAARLGDMCGHGGTIVAGCPTVLIGETCPGAPPSPVVIEPIIAQIGQQDQARKAKDPKTNKVEAAPIARQKVTLTKASNEGSVFCEICK